MPKLPPPSSLSDLRKGPGWRAAFGGPGGPLTTAFLIALLLGLVMIAIGFRAERAADAREDSLVEAREAILVAAALWDPVEHKLIGRIAEDGFAISFQDAVDVGSALGESRSALIERRSVAEDPEELRLIDESVTAIDEAGNALRASSAGETGVEQVSRVLPVAAASQIPISEWVAFSSVLLEKERRGLSQKRQALASGLVAALLLSLLIGFLFWMQLGRARRDTYDLLHTAAVTDPLTGLSNQGAFHDRLAQEIARSRRAGTPLSLVLLDIDHFKTINDTHGHQAGDSILSQIGARLRGASRADELVARIGGEEFAWLVTDADSWKALAVAERARAAIGESEIPGGRRVTASAGVAELEAGEDAEDLVRHADQALYLAKGSGRDTSFRFGPGAAEILAEAITPEDLSPR